MKALVFKDVGKIALETITDPEIKKDSDAIIRITTTTICGTDLHLIRGTISGVKADTVLGHEGVGVVEKIGSAVKHFKVGDRIIIPSTIACGTCNYCEKKLYSQCDKSNPNGPDAGTAFYGGPANSGPFNGMQAEKVRVPFADTNLVLIPGGLSDADTILLSDILPTSYMAVELADVSPNDNVAVFGCGPVGQLAIACLVKMGVKTIFAVDCVPSRLAMAKKQGAMPINFNKADPVKELKKLTNNVGPTKVIDAVGIDAEQPRCASIMCWFKHRTARKEFKRELKKVAPRQNPHGGNWIPGNGPSQALRWAVKAVAKYGTVSIIGVYPDAADAFLIGDAMNRNLTIRMGNCNHRAYFPKLLDWVLDGSINLKQFLTQHVSLDDIVNAYKHFDKRDDNWIKVMVSIDKAS